MIHRYDHEDFLNLFKFHLNSNSILTFILKIEEPRCQLNRKARNEADERKNTAQ